MWVRLSPATSGGVSRVSAWSFDGWWLSCACDGYLPLRVVSKRVSAWSIIKSKHSQLQRENAEIMNCAEAMIGNRIIAKPNEHVRGVTHIFRKPGEGFPRANLSRLFLIVCTRRCKAPFRLGVAAHVWTPAALNVTIQSGHFRYAYQYKYKS